MSVQVVGLGAGGHAKVVLDILISYADYEVVGLLDIDSCLHGQSLMSVPILGDDRLLASIVGQGVTHFFVGLGGATTLFPRRKLYEKGLFSNLVPVSTVHPMAVISRAARIGKGVTVMATAVINPEAAIGDNVIINSGAIVEHDCVIEDHAHIAPGALLSGGVQIGEQTLIGIGVVIKQGIKIGRNVLVGAGAVAVKDVADGQVVMGNPARVRGD
jgi:UDP-perosamine 4-acetyltransferase